MNAKSATKVNMAQTKPGRFVIAISHNDARANDETNRRQHRKRMRVYVMEIEAKTTTASQTKSLKEIMPSGYKSWQRYIIKQHQC